MLVLISQILVVGVLFGSWFGRDDKGKFGYCVWLAWVDYVSVGRLSGALQAFRALTLVPAVRLSP